MTESYNSKLTVLLVEDDDGDVMLVSNAFQEAGNGAFEFKRVDRLEQALDILTGEKVDVVLLDLGLPDARGLETVTRTYAAAPHVPIIVLTSLDDDVTAVKAVKEGVQDYVVKGRIDGDLLNRSIHYAIERKKSEKAIKNALDQKKWLLKELHHRVKNNLQIISSLLNLQAEHIADKQALQAYESSRIRINSILLVHELLYHSVRPSKVDFEEYLRKLTVNLFRAYDVDPNNIRLSIDAHNIFLDVDTAIPCGLATNEIISNSLKHAFPNGSHGRIQIAVSQDEQGKYSLVIGDDGIGLAVKRNVQKSQTLGLGLIETLISNELDGTIGLNTTNGTRYELSFRS